VRAPIRAADSLARYRPAASFGSPKPFGGEHPAKEAAHAPSSEWEGNTLAKEVNADGLTLSPAPSGSERGAHHSDDQREAEREAEREAATTGPRATTGLPARSKRTSFPPRSWLYVFSGAQAHAP
jgi:hypothetical protein